MSFDDDVERLKRELAEERGGDPTRPQRVAALESLRQVLEARIASNRIELRVDDGADTDDEPSLVVMHANTGDELGAIFFDAGEFMFESDDDDYFADVPETSDAEQFGRLMYESLKVGLPAYELDIADEEDA